MILNSCSQNLKISKIDDKYGLMKLIIFSGKDRTGA